MYASMSMEDRLAELCLARKQHTANALAHALPMDDTTRKALAQNVKLLRDSHEWSQMDLAKRSGVKQTTISAVERAVHAATIDTIVNLAAALQVTPWSLLMPGIPPTNHRASAARLMDIYVHLPEAGQEQVDRVAEAESRYHRIKP